MSSDEFGSRMGIVTLLTAQKYASASVHSVRQSWLLEVLSLQEPGSQVKEFRGVHLHGKHFLNTYCMPGTVLDSEDDQALFLPCCRGGTDKQNTL